MAYLFSSYHPAQDRSPSSKNIDTLLVYQPFIASVKHLTLI